MNIFFDSRFDACYARHPLVLADAGARGGLRDNWKSAARHLRFVGFEPDKREYLRLAGSTDDHSTYFDLALHETATSLRLYVARDRGLSSIFEPNRAFLDAFPESSRFDTTDRVEVEAAALDSLVASGRLPDVDFLKVDTQGSELYILRGAAAALRDLAVGVEVEVEFTPIYRDQPLFADVDQYLRGLGYLLFDLRPCYWKRRAGRSVGGPRGQIIWADALYLKGPDALRATLEALEPEARKAKFLKALSVSVLYGYCDYALDLLERLATELPAEDRRVLEARLGASAASGVVDRIPGRRKLASALHRLWRLCVTRTGDAWSVSGAKLGNHF